MSEETTIVEKTNNIEVSRTSTGKHSFSVKLYFKDIAESDSIIEKIADMEKKLAEKYPQ